MLSNQRKLSLCGWLQHNGNVAYQSVAKLQSFLLFYELFSKVNALPSDFSSLAGCRQGSVFENVWNDYILDRSGFDEAAKSAYNSLQESIIDEYAQRSLFVVSILSDLELSDLERKLNMWKAQEADIIEGNRRVELCESDITDCDVRLVRWLEQMYPMPLIRNSKIMVINNHYFLFNHKDAKRLTLQHYDVLRKFSERGQLDNPVFVSLESDGSLLID